MTNTSHDEFFLVNVTSPRNDHINFLLHALRSSSAPPISEINTSLWPVGTEIFYYTICEEADLVIDFFSIECPELPPDIEIVLSDALVDLTERGTALSWFLFEFIYDDPQTLFNYWGSKRVYAFALPGKKPYLALNIQDRQSTKWQDVTRDAIATVAKQFPSVMLHTTIALVKEAWLKEPCAATLAIEQLEQQLNVVLPADYKQFLLWSNGGEGPIGDSYLVLWPVEKVAQLNEDYQVVKYLPDVIIIGTDGGGSGYGLLYKAGTSASLITVPLGDLGSESISILGDSFSVGLQSL